MTLRGVGSATGKIIEKKKRSSDMKDLRLRIEPVHVSLAFTVWNEDERICQGKRNAATLYD